MLADYFILVPYLSSFEMQSHIEPKQSLLDCQSESSSSTDSPCKYEVLPSTSPIPSPLPIGAAFAEPLLNSPSTALQPSSPVSPYFPSLLQPITAPPNLTSLPYSQSDPWPQTTLQSGLEEEEQMQETAARRCDGSEDQEMQRLTEGERSQSTILQKRQGFPGCIHETGVQSPLFGYGTDSSILGKFQDKFWLQEDNESLRVANQSPISLRPDLKEDETHVASPSSSELHSDHSDDAPCHKCFCKKMFKAKRSLSSNAVTRCGEDEMTNGQKFMETVEELRRLMQRMGKQDKSTLVGEFSPQEKLSLRNFQSNIREFNRIVATDVLEDSREYSRQYSNRTEPSADSPWGSVAQQARKDSVANVHSRYKKIIEKMTKEHKKKILQCQNQFNSIADEFLKQKDYKQKTAYLPPKDVKEKEKELRKDIQFKESLKEKEKEPKKEVQWESKQVKEGSRSRRATGFKDEDPMKSCSDMSCTLSKTMSVGVETEGDGELEKSRKLIKQLTGNLKEVAGNYEGFKQRTNRELAEFMGRLAPRREQQTSELKSGVQPHLFKKKAKAHHEKSVEKCENECRHWKDLLSKVSLKVFQISNCIPCEEEDVQSLFQPQNEQEMMEMLLRIESFGRRVESYMQEEERRYSSFKASHAELFKDLLGSPLDISAIKESLKRKESLTYLLPYFK